MIFVCAEIGQRIPHIAVKIEQRGTTFRLGDFRGKPAGLGRARIFAEKSKGLDDPGMLAVNVMIGALAG